MFDDLTFFDDRFDQIVAIAVEDEVEIVRIPDEQVCLFAGLQGADLFCFADCGCGIEGGSGEDLFGSQTIAVAGLLWGG